MKDVSRGRLCSLAVWTTRVSLLPGTPEEVLTKMVLLPKSYWARGPTCPESHYSTGFRQSSGLGEPVRRPGLRPTLSAVAHSLRSNRASDGRQGPEPQTLTDLLAKSLCCLDLRIDGAPVTFWEENHKDWAMPCARRVVGLVTWLRVSALLQCGMTRVHCPSSYCTDRSYSPVAVRAA